MATTIEGTVHRLERLARDLADAVAALDDRLLLTAADISMVARGSLAVTDAAALVDSKCTRCIKNSYEQWPVEQRAALHRALNMLTADGNFADDPR